MLREAWPPLPPPVPLATIPHACASGLPLVAIDPGQEEQTAPVIGTLLRRGRPAVGWCMQCWPVLADVAHG